jgi:hypothetical protein
VRILLLVLVLISCRTSSQIKSLDEVVKSVLGDDVSLHPNNSNTFSLAVKKETTGTISYAVIQLSDSKIIFKKERVRATVSWSEDHKIQEATIPGTIKRDGTTSGITIINLDDYLAKAK